MEKGGNSKAGRQYPHIIAPLEVHHLFLLFKRFPLIKGATWMAVINLGARSDLITPNDIRLKVKTPRKKGLLDRVQ